MKRKISPEAALRSIKFLSTSDLDFKKLVYSNQIFKNILIPIFSQKKETYTLTYGDFNGLDKFNRQFSKEQGTQAIIDSIDVFQDYLPEDTLTVRIAGDEFVFLSPNSKSTDIQDSIQKIHKILESDSNKYLTMSTGVVDSSEISNIFDMYTLAEQRESSAKLETDTTEYSKEIMQSKLDDNFNKFFNNYRFANKMELKNEHIIKLGQLVIKSALDLIVSDEFRNAQLAIKSNAELSSLNTPTVPLFTGAQASLLLNYIQDPSEDKAPDVLSQLYSTQINKFFNELIINPNSNFFNGRYYDMFFKPKIDPETYRPSTMILLDITDIKDCNTKTSHLETDQKISELSSEIQDYLHDNCDIDFDTDISSFDEKKNYIFNQFGGEFLILLGEKSLTPLETFKFLTAINGVNILPMHIMAASSTDKELNYTDSIKSLQNDISKTKSGHLVNSLTSYQTKESLDLFISDSVDFYVKYCPTAFEIQSQREFLEQAILSLTDQAIKSNIEFNNDKKKKNDNER